MTWPPRPTSPHPPADHFYASALWLCARHPRLVELVERVGCLVDTDEDGRWFELDALADAIVALDAYTAAWADYRERTYEPHDDAAWDRWDAAGPKHTNPAAAAIAPMSRTEQSRLRLLAFFSPTRVQLRISDLGGFDDEGQDLLADWCLAVRCAV